MFEQILIPVDFSDANRRALQVAAGLAREHRSRITLLHVIETIDLPPDEVDDFYRELESRAARRLEELVAALAADAAPAEEPLEVEQAIVLGKRTAEILRFSVDHGADLVVMSSHRVELDRLGETIGTVSHQVTILSQCPVLLVK